MGLEKIPAIRPNKQFPIGDVLIDTHRQRKLTEWFLKVEDMDREEYSGHIRFYHAPTSIDGERAFATHQAAVLLCRAWDKSRSTARPYAELGYRLAMTFNRQTFLLPKCDIDLTTELTQMRNEQKHLACEFAEFAWEGMEAYPNVLSCYDRVLEIGRSRYNLNDELDRSYFMAGMALPYVFAWTSRLHGYTPEYIGIRDEKYDPECDDFSRYLMT